MELTTQWILGGLFVVFLLGIMTYIWESIYAPSGPPSPGDQCPAGQTSYPGYGCFSCDPTQADCQVCPAQPCQNGGTCTMVGTNIGACSCPAPYFGKTCEHVCSTNVPCLNGGTCVNGTCQCPAGFGGPNCGTPQTCTSGSTGNCNPPGCDVTTCQCNPGWANDPNSSQLCTMCAPGITGSGCSQKTWNVGIVVGTQSAVALGTGADWACQQDFGPSSSYANVYSNSGAGRYYACNVNPFVADINFDLAAWIANDPTKGAPSNNIQYCGPASYDQFRAKGGVPQGPDTPRNAPCGSSVSKAHLSPRIPPVGRKITTSHKHQ